MMHEKDEKPLPAGTVRRVVVEHQLRPGHFCSALYCYWWTHTHVGPYSISSIGEYRPDYPGMVAKGYYEYDGRTMYRVSADGYYETMVFDTRRVANRWMELERWAYVTARQAHRGHKAVVRRYRNQLDLELA